MLLPSGNPIKCQEEVLSLHPIFPPIFFYIFPTEGCLEGLDTFIFKSESRLLFFGAVSVVPAG